VHQNWYCVWVLYYRSFHEIPSLGLHSAHHFHQCADDTFPECISSLRYDDQERVPVYGGWDCISPWIDM
jgi:hypothetical protein